MTGGMVVVRHGGLITASGHADAVKAEHDDQHSGAIDPAVVDHGVEWCWTPTGCHPMPPWSIQPYASSATGTSVQRIELPPDQVAQCIVHVVKAGVLVRLALVGVALQL